MAGLALIAAVRENDSLLKGVLPAVGWQGVAVVVLIVMAVLVWPGRDRLYDQFGPFVASPAGMIGWTGFILVVIVAQILGQGEQWKG